jgi:hypothetical protein
MQMGGFMLSSDQGTRVGVITDPSELSRAIHAAGFTLPTVEEIHDKSKGDSLCISRPAAGLAIPQMNVVTLALAALNGAIYFLWWNKPLNVHYPVRVVLNNGMLSIQYYTNSLTHFIH